MSAVDYLFQGVGVTPSEGLAATAATLGVASINTSAGPYLFKGAHAQGGQTWGVSAAGTSAATMDIRSQADTGGVGVANKTWARTIALTIPDKLPQVGSNPWTIALYRYFDSTGSTRGNFLGVTIEYVSATTSRIRLNTTTNNTFYDFSGGNIVTAGQKVVIQARGVIGNDGAGATTGLTGSLNAALYSTPGFTSASSPDGTFSSSAVNLRAFPMEVGDFYLSGLVAGDGTVTLGAGYDRFELGRTTYIPLLAATVAAVDSGVPTALDAAGGWTVPSGTILANVADADPASYTDSSAAPATRDEFRVALPRLNPKVSLTVNIDWSVVQSGSLIPDVRLYQGSVQKDVVTLGSSTSASTLPSSVTFTNLGGIAADGGGKWSDLHVGIGAVVG